MLLEGARRGPGRAGHPHFLSGRSQNGAARAHYGRKARSACGGAWCGPRAPSCGWSWALLGTGSGTRQVRLQARRRWGLGEVERRGVPQGTPGLPVAGAAGARRAGGGGPSPPRPKCVSSIASGSGNKSPKVSREGRASERLFATAR